MWTLDPEITFLNHGSFGACPRPVLEAQQKLRDRLEREPVIFMIRDLWGLIDEAREALAGFVGADPEDLVFVPNATTGVNTVLRSLRLEPGDELIVTNHEYNACRNALEFAAKRAGARVTVTYVPYPIESPDQVHDVVMSHVTGKTRLVLLDYVTSPTGLIFPVARIVKALAERGIDTLVDGAHAPGMLDLKLGELGAAYFTGNLHKWVCAPKGAGFLFVRRDRQEEIRPLAMSHGMNSPREGRSRFHDEFDWTGTDDPTAMLCVPEAIRFMGSLLPGGWEELRKRNRDLVLEGRQELCKALGIEPPSPDSMIGSLATLPLPDSTSDGPSNPFYRDPIQDSLLFEHKIEVPIMPWPASPKRVIRISAQFYNSPDQYVRLAEALKGLL